MIEIALGVYDAHMVSLALSVLISTRLQVCGLGSRLNSGEYHCLGPVPGFSKPFWVPTNPKAVSNDQEFLIAYTLLLGRGSVMGY